MPAEVKQRKKPQKQSDEVSESSTRNGKDEAQKVKTEAASKPSSSLDIRSVICVLSLAVCGGLSWWGNNHNICTFLEVFFFCPLLKFWCLLASGWCCSRMRGFPGLRKSTVYYTERLQTCSTWRKKSWRFLKRYVWVRSVEDGWSSKGSFHQTYKKKNETKQYQSTRKGSNKLWIKGKFHPAPEMFCRLAKLLLTLYLHEAE